MVILTDDEKQKLEEAKKTAKKGDLYKALHFVGDDPIKAEIEDVLETVLTPETMATVRAVFNMSTDWMGESWPF